MGNTAYVITGNTLFAAALGLYVVVAALVLFLPRLRRRFVWCFFVLLSLCIAASVILFGLNETEIKGGIPANVSAGYSFTGIAVIVFFLGLYFSIMRKKHRLWFFAGFTLLTVLMLHIAVNFAHPTDYADGAQLSLWAIFARAATSLFQTFSLDAAYVEILRAGESAFAGGPIVFCLMFCLMSVVAPTAGGFAIFGMLCYFFPYLWLYVLCGRRTRYVFSELNEYSIETAESIVRNRNRLRADKRLRDGQSEWMLSSVIIFTDAYSDSDSERSSELLERAKNIGAICLRDDITECDFPWALWRTCKLFRKSRNRSKIVYFLMDINEQSNLKTATAILSPANARLRKVKNVELYVFTQNNDAHDVLKKSYEDLLRNNKNEQLDVYFKTINEYKNLIYRLIDGNDNAALPVDSVGAGQSYPLYHNLVHGKKYDLSKLSVLVVGGGKIGKEFIKAAYWCGQMLSSVTPTGDKIGLPFRTAELNITVIAQNADETERKLRFEMPEVFSDEVQKYGYCKFDFVRADYGSVADGEDGGFTDVFEARCASADYVLVALGDDELNMQAAHRIKRVLDRTNLASPLPVPINYVIENDELCRSLSLSDKENSKTGSILHAFGSLSQRYDYGNIYMTAIEQRAWIAAMTHGKGGDIRNFLMQDYALNSSIATALHYPYKLVVFKGAQNRDIAFSIKQARAAVCWAEHRRWCAYIRSIGMRCPNAQEFIKYAFNDNSYCKEGVDNAKNLLLLHACLLETGENLPDKDDILSARAKYSDRIAEVLKQNPVDKNNKPLPLAEWLNTALPFLPQEFDLLDRLGVLVNYSYKENDVDIVLNLYDDELRAAILKNCVENNLSACKDWARSLVAMHTVADGDGKKIFAVGSDMFIRAGVFDKYNILIGRFDSPTENSYEKSLDLTQSCSLATLNNKPHVGENFMYFFDNNLAMIGIAFGRTWKIGDFVFGIENADGEDMFTCRTA